MKWGGKKNPWLLVVYHLDSLFFLFIFGTFVYFYLFGITIACVWRTEDNKPPPSPVVRGSHPVAGDEIECLRVVALQ